MVSSPGRGEAGSSGTYTISPPSCDGKDENWIAAKGRLEAFFRQVGLSRVLDANFDLKDPDDIAKNAKAFYFLEQAFKDAIEKKKDSKTPPKSGSSRDHEPVPTTRPHSFSPEEASTLNALDLRASDALLNTYQRTYRI